MTVFVAKQPEGHHIASFNWGVLRHDWDDPRVAEFVDNIGRVNALAERTEGFVWRLLDDQMELAQLDPEGPLGGDPRLASTLAVWRDADSLHHFAFKTLHKRFFDKGPAWFDPEQGLRLVLWFVPEGHRPSIAEAAAKVDHLRNNGESAAAFGWRSLALSRG